MKFSIITITKNSGDLFSATAKSIVALNFPDFEWIVVDGSTQDSSINIVNNYSSRIDLLLRGKDRCIAHAFNKGISNSSGEYILLLNAGDCYTPDFLSICASECSPKFINCFSASLVNSNGLCVGLFTSNVKALWRGMHVPHNWMCVPSNIYHTVGLYKEIKHAMDYEWCKRAISIYGISLFRSSEHTGVCGNYLLGGHSDKNYLSGLLSTAKINTTYGMNPAIAYLFVLAYYSRFLLFKFLHV